MMKRTGKFYRNNEAEVMKDFGLKPTKNSGSGWIEKEDGENEKIIAQLKSTDSESIKLNLLDIKKLFYHASISHKVGIFIIQFLSTNDKLILVRPEDVQKLTELAPTSLCDIKPINYTISDKAPPNASSYKIESNNKKEEKEKIKTGSKKSRNKFYEQREKEFVKSKRKKEK